MSRKLLWFVAAVLLSGYQLGLDSRTAALAQTVPEVRLTSTARAHAHNDYEHENPLFDALSHGFIGVEADIWFYDGDGALRVAHDLVSDPTTLKTLQELYFDPLQDQAAAVNNGGIYADGATLLLLIDIKSDGEATYSRLNEVLSQYAAMSPNLFTSYAKEPDGSYAVDKGAVDVVISGNRPRALMERQVLRYAAYDGRKSDAGTGADAAFMPLISDSWRRIFEGTRVWWGRDSIPEETRAVLQQAVADVHAEGKLFRIWGLPWDAPSVWDPLLDAGVDLINTDDLEGLAAFINSPR